MKSRRTESSCLTNGTICVSHQAEPGAKPQGLRGGFDQFGDAGEANREATERVIEGASEPPPAQELARLAEKFDGRVRQWMRQWHVERRAGVTEGGAGSDHAHG